MVDQNPLPDLEDPQDGQQSQQLSLIRQYGGLLRNGNALAGNKVCCCPVRPPETCRDCCRGTDPATLQTINLGLNFVAGPRFEPRLIAGYPMQGFSGFNVYVDFPQQTFQATVALNVTSGANSLIGSCVSAYFQFPSPVSNFGYVFSSQGPIVRYTLYQKDCVSEVSIESNLFVTNLTESGSFNNLPVLQATYGSFNNCLRDLYGSLILRRPFVSKQIVPGEYGLPPSYLCLGTGQIVPKGSGWGLFGTGFIQFLGVA